MPNRIIKDSIIISRKVSELNDFQFRLWVHLIVFVDDFGRGNADPFLIKGMLFPRIKSITVSMIEQAVNELAEKGLIALYREDGETFFFFPNWDKHQRIRAKVSKHPAPNVNNLLTGDRSLLTNDSKMLPNPIQSNTNPNPIQSNTSIRIKDKYGAQNFDQKIIKMSDLQNSFIE